MSVIVLFFFNDTATTEIYTLSLHDALPICPGPRDPRDRARRPLHVRPRARAGDALRRHLPAASRAAARPRGGGAGGAADRKSTRLNSSHANISYAVFCL